MDLNIINEITLTDNKRIDVNDEHHIYYILDGTVKIINNYISLIHLNPDNYFVSYSGDVNTITTKYAKLLLIHVPKNTVIHHNPFYSLIEYYLYKTTTLVKDMIYIYHVSHKEDIVFNYNSCIVYVIEGTCRLFTEQSSVQEPCRYFMDNKEVIIRKYDQIRIENKDKTLKNHQVPCKLLVINDSTQ